MQGILPGIKVNTGAKPLAGCPGETITEGLDGPPRAGATVPARYGHFVRARPMFFCIARNLPTRPTCYCWVRRSGS
jgi:fructose-bisphosphate aldolase class I